MNSQRRKRRIHPGVAGLLVILVVLGLGCLGLGCHLTRKSAAVKSWTEVDAVITKSGTVSLNTRNQSTGQSEVSEQPQIGFEYSVDGRTYQGSRFNGRNSPPPHEALAKYPTGARVRAYYDPANPSDAVLTNDASVGFEVFFFIFGTFVLLAAGLVAFVALGGRTAPPIAPATVT